MNIPEDIVTRLMIAVWGSRDLLYSLRKDEGYIRWDDILQEQINFNQETLDWYHNFKVGGEIPQEDLYEED